MMLRAPLSISGSLLASVDVPDDAPDRDWWITETGAEMWREFLGAFSDLQIELAGKGIVLTLEACTLGGKNVG